MNEEKVEVRDLGDGWTKIIMPIKTVGNIGYAKIGNSFVLTFSSKKAFDSFKEALETSDSSDGAESAPESGVVGESSPEPVKETAPEEVPSEEPVTEEPEAEEQGEKITIDYNEWTIKDIEARLEGEYGIPSAEFYKFNKPGLIKFIEGVERKRGLRD